LDAGGRGSASDLSPRHEAATLIDRGIVTPDEALTMLTTSAAWAVNCEHTAGRLISGRPADLAILAPDTFTANAAADALTPSTRVLATLRNGRPIFQTGESPLIGIR